MAVNLPQTITFVVVMVTALVLGLLAPQPPARWVPLRRSAGGLLPEGRSMEKVLTVFAGVMALLVLLVVVLGAVRVAAL